MKTILFKLASLSVVLVLLLTACGLPGAATPEPAATGEPGVTTEPAPTEVPAPEVLPTGFTDLLEAKVASGEWTQEEGLLTLLKLFAGEIQPGEASLGAGVLEAEGAGVLDLAIEYLQTGTDEAVKAEITRLLNVLIPSQAALDLYSVPEDQADHRTPGMAAPARQDQDCAALWAAGFPDTRTPSFRCFQYGEGSVSGQRYRVYYPLAWRGDPIREAFYDATLEAAGAALTTYQAYGTIRPINFIFTTLDDARNPATTLATAYWDTFRPGEACPVVIYPQMLSLDGDPFRQSVAHEVFHCFESWNLHDQGIGAGYNSSKWWVEGAAEYFSNLVYPSVNYEYRFAGSFSNRSNAEPLTSMTYENFVFFQFLGNQSGPNGVMAFLRQMPAIPGVDRQLTAMAAVPGIEDTWEAFARAVLDRTLLDTNGSVADIPPSYTSEYSIRDIGSVTVSGKPFIFARHRVTFGSEREFAVLATSAGAGRSAARPGGTTGGWAAFPATVAGGCADLPYLVYTLTTAVGAERVETVTTTLATEMPCDECLVGAWTSTSDSVLAYMRSILNANPNPDVTIVGVTGAMYVEFRENGTSAGGYDSLIVHQRIEGSGLTGVVSTTDMFINFIGSSSGTYTANGSTLAGSGGSSTVTVTVDTYVNDASMGSTTIPFRPEDFPVTAPLPTRYTCSGNTLTMWPPVPGMTVEPIVYHRTSP